MHIFTLKKCVPSNNTFVKNLDDLINNIKSMFHNEKK